MNKINNFDNKILGSINDINLMSCEQIIEYNKQERKKHIEN